MIDLTNSAKNGGNLNLKIASIPVAGANVAVVCDYLVGFSMLGKRFSDSCSDGSNPSISDGIRTPARKWVKQYFAEF